MGDPSGTRIRTEDTMAGVYDILRDRAYERSAHLDDEAFLVKGLWKVDLAFKPNANERVFRYSFLVAQTMGQGCCYCDKNLEIDTGLIGKDAREIVRTKDCYSIAILDSIFASIVRHPQVVHKFEGNSVEKAGKRASIIAAEVNLLAERMGKSPGDMRVLNAGVVGNIVLALKNEGYDVVATDLDENLVGREMHGVKVDHGTRTYSYVKGADVAIITGMTLTTDSLTDIVDTAKRHDTRVLMFAETGANMGEEYTSDVIGVDICVSEPFPFYIFQGLTTVEVYRAKWLR
jgi:hypothetical protein